MLRLPAAVLVVCAFLMALGGAQASAASSPAKSVSALVRQVQALPAGSVSKVQRKKLLKAATHARKVLKKKPCSAVSDLARFRRVLRTVRVPKGKKPGKRAQRVAALGPSSLKASQQLLGDKRTKRCGGGERPSTRGEAATQVLQSDENGMKVRVQMPVLRFVPETGGGQTWTKLAAPDTDSPGKPGTPGIPTVAGNFAVPDGASLKVTGTNATTYTVGGVDVLPAQPDPVDDDTAPPDITKPPFATPAFTLDKQAYKSNAPVPAQPADGLILGTSRDVVIGGLQIPAAQYLPASKTLKVIKSIDVTVVFQGGPHTFSDELRSPWETPQNEFLATLLNRDLFRSRFGDLFRRCGEQMLVVTNPSTRPVADTFANAKRAQGMRTNVFEIGAGSGQIGTTPAEIQSFIRGRLTSFLCIHPSYVTIMGDDELVPTFTDGPSGIPSDLKYSMRNDADELPDVAVGRMLGQDTAQLNTIVSKVVNYENSPPTGPMLKKATIAAQFQDDNADGREERTFTQFAETVRTGLVGRGVTVDRVYTDSPTTTPLKFNDGTDLPAELKKPTFAWNGTGADVTADWNDGRFLVIHRDHGYSDGWVHPGYGTADAQALTNGAKLPVVLSVNCSSAAYDYDETSFTQQALTNPNGGAVGVFGDTRDSPTWHNSQLALGFVDALLPSVLPAEGPATKQTVGNALINGKLRLAGLAPPATDGSTRQELYLWHYFGDPSMSMWGGDPPHIWDPGLFNAVFEKSYTGPPVPGDPPPYQVNVTLPQELAGQPVALVRGGDTVGKAVAGKGSASVPAAFGDGSPKPGDLSVVVEPADGPPVKVPVSGVPDPNPPPPADTRLSQTCPSHPETYFDVEDDGDFTVTGKLSPGFAGAKITLTYTTPAGNNPPSRSFERSVTTDANGNWTDTIKPKVEESDNPRGDWKVKSRYDGDAGHKASSTETCTVRVQDNS